MNLLLRGILSKTWAIDESFLQAHLPMISALINGQSIDTSTIKTSSYEILAASGSKSNSSFSNAEKGSIAVVDLQGPMMKHDQACGPAGTATIAGWIKQADANPNIDGIVLKVDSPGGTVDGTEELARVIKATRKPIVGFIDGMAASASYWAVSQCDEIIASGKTSTIGSIGVMSSFSDWKPVLEKNGVKFHEAYATLSTEKNKPFRDAAQGDYTSLVAELDSINNIFHSTIRTARPGAKDAVYNGAHYLSAEAKKLGLIDKIGTMDDAVKAIRQKTNSTKMSNTKNLAAYPALCNALGFTEGFETTDEGAHLSEESLATLEAQLVAGANSFNQLGGLTVERDANALALANATDQLAEKNIEITGLKAQLTALGGQRAHSGSATAAAPETITENQKPPSKYVPDGTEMLAEKYKMNTEGWFS